MINPTGGKIRCDTEGQGYYGAPRGNRKHKGVDFECVPGQPVFSPIDGKVIRQAYPYSSDRKYNGLLIENPSISIKIFYIAPFKVKIGHNVKAGDKIGIAQDISEKYSDKMKPHIHLQIDSVDPMIFINMP